MSRRLGVSTSTSRLALIALLGAGASSLTFPALAETFEVNNASGLANAINNASNGDTINIAPNITLSADLPNISKSVILNGAGFSLDGANRYRGLILGDTENTVNFPTIAINNLTIANTIAKGGDGGPGGPDAGGGGGTGLGGALLVMNGANVTATTSPLRAARLKGAISTFREAPSSVG